MNPTPNAGVCIDRRDTRAVSRYVVAIEIEDDDHLRRRTNDMPVTTLPASKAVTLLDGGIAKNWAVGCQVVCNAVNGNQRAGWANNRRRCVDIRRCQYVCLGNCRIAYNRCACRYGKRNDIVILLDQRTGKRRLGRVDRVGVKRFPLRHRDAREQLGSPL